MRFSEERSMFIDRMIEAVKSLPIQKIVSSRMSLTQRGRHLMGLCPFHKDKHLGSFLVTPDKGLWRCFACGEDFGGDGIKFIMEYDGIPWLEAVLKIAMEQGLCSLSEYDKYCKGKDFTKTYKTKVSNRAQQLAEKKEPDVNPVICDAVYTTMAQICGLSAEHRKHLTDVRQVPESHLGNYFSFPYTNKEKEALVNQILTQLNWVKEEDLIKVPGFFKDKKTHKISLLGCHGIGILIHNTKTRKNGLPRVVAVQIRRDTVKEGEQRYIWFSSSFAQYDEKKYEGGNGCGSPKDVMFPEGEHYTGCVCITEGRFKAERIVAQGNISISVQGVSSWKGIEDIIAEIRTTHPIKAIYIMFDADMMVNPVVFNHEKAMGEALLAKGYKVVHVSWPVSLGKGIDDVLTAAGPGALSYLPFAIAVVKYEQILAQAFAKYGIKTLRELPDEKVDIFFSELRSEMENHMCKKKTA